MRHATVLDKQQQLGRAIWPRVLAPLTLHVRLKCLPGGPEGIRVERSRPRVAANARNEGGAAGGHRRARETDWTAPHSLRYLHVRFRQAHARAEPGGMRRIPEHKERAIGTLQRGDSHFGWCERLLRYLLVSHQAPGPTGEEPAAQEESELAAAEECREFRVDGPRGAHERLGKLGEAGAPGPRCTPTA